MKFEGILTEQALKDMPQNKIFATGEIENGPEEHQIFMERKFPGRKLKYVAQRGLMHDWVIYVDWADKTYTQVLNNGDTVLNSTNIKKIIQADVMAMALYRDKWY